MSGVNGDARGIKGALKFQARVARAAADGKTCRRRRTRFPSPMPIRSRCSSPPRRAIKIITMSAAIPKPSPKSKLPARQQQESFDEAARRAHRRVSKIVPPRPVEPGRRTEPLNLPTDERITHFADGNDPQLAALYFQFARYLLISCSRPGGQPATLQGLWNDSMTPPWDSKYTININTEMNYWPAETCNLAECVEPLTQMVLEMAQDRRAHGQGDVWRARLGGASQHRPLARDRRRLTARTPACGRWAARGCATSFWDTLPVHRRQKVFEENLSGHERRGAILPRHAGRGADASLARHLSVALAGKRQSRRRKHQHHAPGRRWTWKFCATCSPTASARRKFWARTRNLPRKLAATRAQLAPLQIGSAGPVAGMAAGFGPAVARPASPPRLASLRTVSQRAD